MDKIFIHLPKHLIRYETGGLSIPRLSVSTCPESCMQDYCNPEGADNRRLDEFLSAYSECGDDDCFCVNDNSLLEYYE